MTDENIRRRASDRRTGFDRRFAHHRRAVHATPPWPEQRAQFLTRFLFWALGAAYFYYHAPFADSLPTPAAVAYVFVTYFILTALFMVHAYRVPQAPARWRAAMWIDIAFVSFCVVADRGPTITPALLAYLAVILGNGMRYSMHFFREAVVATFILGGGALFIRYADNVEGVNLATVFVLMFGAIIVLYSYSLMSRIEGVKQRLENEGRIDALTGLLNRRALFEKAEVLFDNLARSGKTVAVLFADLNKFKAINDQLGHRAGDRVLVQIAQILGRSTRKADIAARYGGDEFVLVLPDTDLAKANVLAARLQRNINEWVMQQPLDLSISIGIGEAPRHGADLTSVLENVDKAMYRGKLDPQHTGIRSVDDGNPNSMLH